MKLRRLLQPRSALARALPALTVSLATAFFLLSNAAASRWVKRWDLSSGARFSLSEPSQELLSGLREDVEIISVFSAEDPERGDVLQRLWAYRAANSHIILKALDPSRDQAEVLALGKNTEEKQNPAENEALVSDTALVVRSGERQLSIARGELSEVDAEGHPSSRLEAKLTEALAQLLEHKTTKLCLTAGHGERSSDDNGPEGLGLWTRRLELEQFDSQRVELDQPNPREALQTCELIALLGPSRELSREAESAVWERFEAGARLLLVLAPQVDSNGQVRQVPLSAMTRRLGLEPGSGFVLERDPALRLPQGLGEEFYPEVQAHPATAGLSRQDARLDARPLLQGTGALELLPGSEARALLRSSPQAAWVTELRLARPVLKDKSFTLAAAVETKTPSGALRRAVVIASETPFLGESWLEARFHGNRVLARSMMRWLAKAEALTELPPPPPRPAGLEMSEAAASRVFHSVLIGMPLLAAFSGFLLLWRRKYRARAQSQRRLSPSENEE